MDDNVVTILLAGPLYLLGALQLFGAHRLWTWRSIKILFWGLVVAALGFPLLFLVRVVDAAPGIEPHLEMGGRLVRIWLIVFTLASVARIGLLIVKYVWRRRPRGHTAPLPPEAERRSPRH